MMDSELRAERMCGNVRTSGRDTTRSKRNPTFHPAPPIAPHRSSAMSGALLRRRRALALFRACLRSAAQCPRGEHAEQMRALTRLKYRDARTLRDAARVDVLLDEGERELASLEYMHAVREGRATTHDEVLASVRSAMAATAARQPPARAGIAAAATVAGGTASAAETGGTATASPSDRGLPSAAAPCAACGAALASATARFCSECGARVQS